MERVHVITGDVMGNLIFSPEMHYVAPVCCWKAHVGWCQMGDCATNDKSAVVGTLRWPVSWMKENASIPPSAHPIWMGKSLPLWYFDSVEPSQPPHYNDQCWSVWPTIASEKTWQIAPTCFAKNFPAEQDGFWSMFGQLKTLPVYPYGMASSLYGIEGCYAHC